MSIWSVVKFAGWLGYLAGALLILQNTIADYGPNGAGVFIAQKGELGSAAWWVTSLRIHVFAGLVCLFSCLLQFSRVLLRSAPAMHRMLGKIYAATVLFALCPTGIVLALAAKGGWAGRAGFLLLGAATFHATLLGITSMLGKRPDLASHRRWMTRSFAFAATAVTFRFCHFALFQCGVADEVNYVASLYFSIVGNAAVAELLLRSRPFTRSIPNPIASLS